MRICVLLNTLDENTCDFSLWGPEHTYDYELIKRDGKEVGCASEPYLHMFNSKASLREG